MTDPRPKPIECTPLLCPKLDNSTLVSLREYIEARLMASQQALDLARQLMDARLDGLNHLRSQVLTKSEYESAHTALIARHDGDQKVVMAAIADIREWKAEQRGKASMTSVYAAYFLGCLGLVISLVSLWHEIASK